MILTALVLLAGIYMGWNLGANDGANSMGTAVGARVRTVREAVILVAVFGFLGATIYGRGVIKTIGRGIVPLDELSGNVSLVVALAAMFGASLWLQIASYLKIPVSTTHSTVGAVAGAGLAYGNVTLQWGRLVEVVVAWLVTPLGAGLLAYILYQILRRLILPRWPLEDRTFGWLLTASGIYMAFTWGSNDVANATGVMVGAGVLSSTQAALLGGVAIAAGVAMWGPRVMETVGSGITSLQPAMAFIAELAAALNVHIYTALGIPVSTTHAIVGAIVGVGLVHGRAAVNAKTGRDIMIAWGATPVAAGIVTFILFKLFQAVFL
ncbi:MAG TPA: inorganic phosphate transporter [Sphingobacteriaceae bacterium]|nr:inorganic phosphate transporter [Sphingobacteriaceae bacterium]